jgi:hypothetical protein
MTNDFHQNFFFVFSTNKEISLLKRLMYDPFLLLYQLRSGSDYRQSYNHNLICTDVVADIVVVASSLKRLIVATNE